MARLLFYIKILFVLTLIILGFAPVYGQNRITAKYLDIGDGLSNNVVTAVFRDHNGFMWFGTYDGLNKYDGYGFKVFRNIIGDSNSINSNIINKIDEDRQHNLWIGGHRDVSIFNPVTAKFSTPSYILQGGKIKRSLEDNVVEVKVLDKQNILIGTEHNGLFYFQNNESGRQVAINENGQSKTEYYVSAIAYDSSTNVVYIFVQNKGLFEYDPKTHQLRKQNTTIENANFLLLDRKRNLWVGGNNGLYLYNKNINSFSKNYVPDKTSVTSMLEDKQGRLWIVTDGSGILLLGTDQKIATPLSAIYPDAGSKINSNSIYSIYEDGQQRIWIGTLRGGVNILELRPNPISKVVYGEGKNTVSPIQNFISSFCEEDKEHIWIGTDGAGLRYWNRNDNTFQNYLHNSANPSSLSDNFITSIVKDANNNIWVSTWFGGINLFNQESKTFEHFTCFNTSTNSYNNHCWFLFEDSRKRLWAATVRNGALYRYNYITNNFQEFDDNLSDIQCISEDSSGNLWCGDYTSLIKIDTLHKKHKFYNIGYATRCIHEDRYHNFWVGTQEGGLLLFNRTAHTFTRFTTANGLPNNTILRILEDEQGNLWLSTFNGLSKFDIRKKTFLNFTQADGLQSNQFSFNAALALSTGELLFGGIKGFNVFSPESMSVKNVSPQLFLSALKINNVPVEDNPGFVTDRDYEQIKKIIVPYNKASLSLDFLALDYKQASTLNYAYILKGWDKSWIYASHTRVANYSRLHEGDYIFQVKVSGSDGVWSNADQLLEVTILPPWYRTWWAYCLYIISGVAIINLYLLYKNRQTKLKYEVKLAHLETQQEKELNEKKIAFFTNISHEFRTPLSLIINPINDLLHSSNQNKENGELKVVYRNAKRLLRLVDQLLLFKKAEEEKDNLNLANINFFNLCNEVFLCFAEQAKTKCITYKFICPDNLKGITINADSEKIEIALFNLLSNAFKYTPQDGKVILSINETSSHMVVSVKDTGIGIPANAGNKVFQRFYQMRDQNKSGFGIGLYLVRNFVEAHKGNVYYQSIDGEGTTFIIELPKKTAQDYQPAIHKNPIKAEKSTQDKIDYSISAETDNPDKTEVEKQGDGISAAPVSELLLELNEEVLTDEQTETEHEIPEQLASDKQVVLIIDDDAETRNYLSSVFKPKYKILVADSAETGLEVAQKQLPDLIISDIVMKALTGIDLCHLLKDDKAVSHIPIILLTGSSSDEMQLKGIESGADEYIRKPFDKDVLVAKVASLLKRRNILQEYFYNEITLGGKNLKVSPEYKQFLEDCMRIIEDHIDNDQFNIKILATEIGMSHSKLYRKIKTVSGQTISGFIRYVRLKKAAELLINTEYNVAETANTVGFYDVKYFRKQFSNLFGITPSGYIKKYRKNFHNNQNLEEKFRK